MEILIEAKKPDNVAEMFKANKPNCKALHECILYYFRERDNNTQLKYILITDFYQFYLFRAKEFERYFYKNKKIQDAYKSLNKKDLLENQKDFYAELAKILSKEFQGNLEGDLFNTSLQGTHFDLRNDKHFKQSYATLNKEFLHDEFHRDSNALNPKFYYELLHILGLKEIETKGKILIQIDETQKNSFAKHIADKLKNNNKPSDFETTMSHIIVWLNRILFLKLIEANLLHFNHFDENLRFLTSAKIKSFSTLAHLFFEVLARDYEARETDKGFHFLPYLNSSLFIKDEKEICDLSALDDDLEILPFATTQTEHERDKPVCFLVYLFDFLECFDFGKSQDSNLSDKLINSSVLGAMFEKLNGYQEGSFYTPNFITSYMCKESLSKIVVEKFNDSFGWNAKDIESLRKQIDRDFGRVESQAKQILSSIRICDPSVGSGHFLVSALNEMIAIYHKLGLLEFGYKDLQIKDDEIHLTTKEGEKFAYKRLQDSNHTIQIALFELKKSIIENNLFGVDINPNSCNIARLRLWIELLKNAYYLNFSKDKDSKIHKLQTLPNIDINIKCGNSLISHIGTNITLDNFTANLQNRLIAANKKQDLFLNQSLNSEIKDIEKKAQNKFQEMHENAESYKNENNKQTAKTYKDAYENAYQYLCKLFKRNCDEYINFHQVLKDFFTSYGYINLTQLESETKFYIESYVEFFDFHKSVDFERKTSREIPQKEPENLLKLMQIYEEFNQQATFEWRFAFPEVLDSNGDFLGFDLVIGNPPYIKEADNKRLFDGTRHLRTYQGKMDIWYHFVGLGFDIVKNQGIVTFIATQNWITNTGAKNLRNVILKESQILNLVDFGSYMCFDAASIQTMIMEFQKLDSIPESYTFTYAKIESKKPTDKHREAILKRESFEDNIYLEPSITPSQMLNKSLTFADSKQEEVLNKILENGTFYLRDDEAQIGIGLTDKVKKKMGLTNYEVGTGIFQISTKELKSLHLTKSELKLIKPLYTSNELFRFYGNPNNNEWVIYTDSSFKNPNSMDKYPNLKKHLDKFRDVITSDNKPYGLHRAKQEYFFNKTPSIVSLRKCPDKPIFTYVDFDCYVTSTFFIIQTSRIDLKFLTGLLNSKLIAFWLRHKGKMQGNNYQIDKEPLMNIPLIEITEQNEKNANQIIALVDEILNLKAKDSTTDTSKLESEIDKLAYRLYNLNENEISIIEK